MEMAFWEAIFLFISSFLSIASLSFSLAPSNFLEVRSVMVSVLWLLLWSFEGCGSDRWADMGPFREVSRFRRRLSEVRKGLVGPDREAIVLRPVRTPVWRMRFVVK